MDGDDGMNGDQEGEKMRRWEGEKMGKWEDESAKTTGRRGDRESGRVKLLKLQQFSRIAATE